MERRSARDMNLLQSSLPFEGPGAEEFNACPLDDENWLVSGDGKQELEAFLEVRPRLGREIVQGAVSLGSAGQLCQRMGGHTLPQHAAAHSYVCLHGEGLVGGPV